MASIPARAISAARPSCASTCILRRSGTHGPPSPIELERARYVLSVPPWRRRSRRRSWSRPFARRVRPPSPPCRQVQTVRSRNSKTESEDGVRRTVLLGGRGARAALPYGRSERSLLGTQRRRLPRRHRGTPATPGRAAQGGRSSSTKPPSARARGSPISIATCRPSRIAATSPRSSASTQAIMSGGGARLLPPCPGPVGRRAASNRRLPHRPGRRARSPRTRRELLSAEPAGVRAIVRAAAGGYVIDVTTTEASASAEVLVPSVRAHAHGSPGPGGRPGRLISRTARLIRPRRRADAHAQELDHLNQVIAIAAAAKLIATSSGPSAAKRKKRERRHPDHEREEGERHPR